jgi:hypothetical protein
MLLPGDIFIIDTHGKLETVVYECENGTPQINQPRVYWGRLPNGQFKSFYKSQIVKEVKEINSK